MSCVYTYNELFIGNAELQMNCICDMDAQVGWAWVLKVPLSWHLGVSTLYAEQIDCAIGNTAVVKDKSRQHWHMYHRIGRSA